MFFFLTKNTIFWIVYYTEYNQNFNKHDALYLEIAFMFHVVVVVTKRLAPLILCFPSKKYQMEFLLLFVKIVHGAKQPTQ